MEQPAGRQATARAEYERIMTSASPEPAGAYIETGVIGFVFGEMWRRGVLTARDRRFITLACVGAVGAITPIETHVWAALNSGDLTYAEFDEFVLFFGTQQGWPKASVLTVHGMTAAFRLAEERGEPFAQHDFERWVEPVDDDTRRQRGEAAYLDVHGVAGPAAPTAFHGRAYLDFLYGEIWTRRKYLTRRDRRIVSICSAAAAGVDDEVAEHLARRARDAGAQLRRAPGARRPLRRLPRLAVGPPARRPARRRRPGRRHRDTVSADHRAARRLRRPRESGRSDGPPDHRRASTRRRCGHAARHARPLPRHRGVRGGDPAALGAASDILGICVVDDAGVDDVLRGPDGALAAMADGSVVIVHSTVHPHTCLRLQDDFPNLRVLDAPVSGGGHKAAEGELFVMVGGPTEVVEWCRPVLETFGDPVLHMGGLGSGQEAKILDNAVFAAQLAVAAEVFALAAARGLDRQAVATVVSNGSAAELRGGGGGRRRLRARGTRTVRGRAARQGHRHPDRPRRFRPSRRLRAARGR